MPPDFEQPPIDIDRFTPCPGCGEVGFTVQEWILLDEKDGRPVQMMVCRNQMRDCLVNRYYPEFTEDEETETLAEYTIAPNHAADLADVEPITLEGVAYAPTKCTFLSSSQDEDLLVVCGECDWQTEVGNLPQEDVSVGYEQPDMCPDCAKQGEIGHVRCQSPADGSLPAGWEVSE